MMADILNRHKTSSIPAASRAKSHATSRRTGCVTSSMNSRHDCPIATRQAGGQGLARLWLPARRRMSGAAREFSRACGHAQLVQPACLVQVLHAPFAADAFDHPPEQRPKISVDISIVQRLQRVG